MLNVESKVEAVLFFKNEPVTVNELAKWLSEEPEAIENAITQLSQSLQDRGIVLVSDGKYISLGTHPSLSADIKNLQKEEFSRELGRAGLETLAIILYRGPLSRREIDHIRGVNSGFILRSLLVRGLIERTDPALAGQVSLDRSYNYKATLKLLEYLGIGSREDLPEYKNAFKKIEDFVKTVSTEQDG